MRFNKEVNYLRTNTLSFHLSASPTATFSIHTIRTTPTMPIPISTSFSTITINIITITTTTNHKDNTEVNRNSYRIIADRFEM